MRAVRHDMREKYPKRTRAGTRDAKHSHTTIDNKRKDKPANDFSNFNTERKVRKPKANKFAVAATLCSRRLSRERGIHKQKRTRPRMASEDSEYGCTTT